jgi:hypothetical protein
MDLPRLARLIAAAFVVAIVAAPAARAAETGLNLSAPFEEGRPASAFVDHSGAQWARNFVSWNELEPARGQFNTQVLDALAASTAALRSHGIKPTFVVAFAPAWATGSTDPHAPPTDPADYAAFVAYLASYPGIKGNVVAYEIWNEEDAPGWWTGAPDAAAYTRLLQAAYPAIKAADPTATVLVGGLTGNDYTFLEQIYAAGGGGSFDGVGVHTDTACNLVSPDSYYRDPNGRVSQFSFTGYREVHQTMVAHGDGVKDIYMTELGWSTSTKRCDQGVWQGKKAGGVSAADQASYLTQAYACLAADPYVKMAAWFTAQDTSTADTPNMRFGLLSAGSAQKPAAKAFKRVASKAPEATRCGGYVDLAAPTISVAAPRQGQQFTADLPITVSGTDNQHLGTDRALLRRRQDPQLRRRRQAEGPGLARLAGREEARARPARHHRGRHRRGPEPDRRHAECHQGPPDTARAGDHDHHHHARRRRGRHHPGQRARRPRQPADLAHRQGHRALQQERRRPLEGRPQVHQARQALVHAAHPPGARPPLARPGRLRRQRPVPRLPLGGARGPRLTPSLYT